MCATSSTKAHGVAEVASVGGFVKSTRSSSTRTGWRATGFRWRVSQVIRESNRDVGGRVVELAEKEFMVRGKGYLKGVEDIETPGAQGRWRHAGAGPRRGAGRTGAGGRRGITELNGEGEVASGIAMARFGQNALDVIANVKAKIEELKPGLPAGTEIVPVYDRAP